MFKRDIIIDGSSPMNQYRQVVRKTHALADARKLTCPPFFLTEAHGLVHANEYFLWGEDLSSRERDS